MYLHLFDFENEIGVYNRIKINNLKFKLKSRVSNYPINYNSILWSNFSET